MLNCYLAVYATVGTIAWGTCDKEQDVGGLCLWKHPGQNAAAIGNFGVSYECLLLSQHLF